MMLKYEIVTHLYYCSNHLEDNDDIEEYTIRRLTQMDWY